MTEEATLQRYLAAERVGTPEIRDLPENDEGRRANMTSSWQRNV